MNKQSFLDLLTRYQQGNCTESEKTWVNQWYNLLGDKNIKNLSSVELNEMKDSVWLKLEKHTRQPTKTRTLKTVWFKVAIAASITIAFVISSLYLTRNRSEQSFLNANSELSLISKTNTSSKPILILLSDKSEITLKPNASIIYPKVFAVNGRKVYLKGDAFFSISKNRKKPFYVYNNNLVVRVLGTSFFIKESAHDLPAEVAVRTGKVRIDENTDCRLITLPGTQVAKPVLLTPNQKGVYKNHVINSTVVEEPILLSVAYNKPEVADYNFKEERLSAIFKTLSKAYGIEIKSENSEILDYTFTGDMNSKGLYEQLSLICGSISGKYDVIGTTILVSNKK